MAAMKSCRRVTDIWSLEYVNIFFFSIPFVYFLAIKLLQVFEHMTDLTHVILVWQVPKDSEKKSVWTIELDWFSMLFVCFLLIHEVVNENNHLSSSFNLYSAIVAYILIQILKSVFLFFSEPIATQIKSLPQIVWQCLYSSGGQLCSCYCTIYIYIYIYQYHFLLRLSGYP